MTSTPRSLSAGLFRVATLLAFLSATLLAAGTAAAGQATISPEGQALARQLDGLDVEHHWIAGSHIDWRTGVPDGAPETGSGRHTHCSAFVAAAAETMGIYVLRPPEHGQLLLANAQNEWLEQDGAAEGWYRLEDAFAAQKAANRGQLVLATYHNHSDRKPGHIAIVRPSAKSVAAIEAEGPDVTQAGLVNHAATTLRAGFAGHATAWTNDEVAYYAHTVAGRDRNATRAGAPVATRDVTGPARPR